MRVAIIHYWFVGMRGGEKVVEEMLRLYPDAELFTHVVDRESISPSLAARPITQSFIGSMPGAKKHYQKYLGLMPRALEELDFRGFDLILSSESGPSKGIIPPPGAVHVCYIHSPMRYIWDQYPQYRDGIGNRIKRAAFSRLAHRLRQWDFASSARVDHFVANSSFVAERVRNFYRRDAAVVHPPVDLGAYTLPQPPKRRRHFLFVSELVPYKRADLVVEAFRGSDERLLIVGDGPARAALERNLPPNVTLLGRVPSEDLAGLYQSAKALIFPAEEDFGIVPLEAMASGTPVLAFGRGGARDTVIEGETGLFFHEQSAEAIRDVLVRFEAHGTFSPERLAAQAARFSAERFRAQLKAEIETAIAAKGALLAAARPTGRGA